MMLYTSTEVVTKSEFKLIEIKYSESRLMLSPVNVIIRLTWSLFIVPFTNAD